MSQNDRAAAFQKLHIKGQPVILFNIWDAGSAVAVTMAGAQAIATGSHSVASAYGSADGEELPMDVAIDNARRICAAVDLPVTIDFEGGYAEDVEQLKKNIAEVIATGAVGINFEDQIIGGEGLYSIDTQAARIRAVREAADEAGVNLFINARMDLFLKNLPAEDNEELLEAAIERAVAYSGAGASGFFAPGLRNAELIKKLCDASPLPVNIMVMSDTPSNAEMASLGVARISYGPGPYAKAMEFLKEEAGKVFGN